MIPYQCMGRFQSEPDGPGHYVPSILKLQCEAICERIALGIYTGEQVYDIILYTQIQDETIFRPTTLKVSVVASVLRFTVADKWHVEYVLSNGFVGHADRLALPVWLESKLMKCIEMRCWE